MLNLHKEVVTQYQVVRTFCLTILLTLYQEALNTTFSQYHMKPPRASHCQKIMKMLTIHCKAWVIFLANFTCSRTQSSFWPAVFMDMSDVPFVRIFAASCTVLWITDTPLNFNIARQTIVGFFKEYLMYFYSH